MRLILSQIQKNIELQDLYLIQKSKYYKSIWKEGINYSIALAVLGESDPEAKRKNRILRSFLSKDGINLKQYLKLQKYLGEHSQKVNQAIEYMNNEESKKNYAESTLFRRTNKLAPFGILAFELWEV